MQKMSKSFQTHSNKLEKYIDILINDLLSKEDYQDLPLVVQDSPNLQNSLANMFTIHEHLIGDNQYRCSSCANTLCDAEKVKKTKLNG